MNNVLIFLVMRIRSWRLAKVVFAFLFWFVDFCQNKSNSNCVLVLFQIIDNNKVPYLLASFADQYAPLVSSSVACGSAPSLHASTAGRTFYPFPFFHHAQYAHHCTLAFVSQTWIRDQF